MWRSTRHHREVLEELNASFEAVGADYLFFINPSLKRLNEYAIPYVPHYINAQAKSGHTRHYEECFYRQRGSDGNGAR